MVNRIGSSLCRVLIGICVLVLFSQGVFSLVIVNESDIGFSGPEKVAIRGNVIEGAGYFLKAQAGMLLLSNGLELAEIQGHDYSGWNELVDEAILNLENAWATYAALANMSDNVPYDPGIQDTLVGFDYTAFQQAHPVNSIIFAEVKTFLQVGDIRGVYRRLRDDTGYILSVLNEIKGMISAHTFPKAEDIWEANQAFSMTLLFGQYTAQIFYAVAGK